MTWNGDALRAIRQAQKVGLRKLSRLTGLDRGYLGRLERGEVKKPGADKVQQIADALAVPTSAINPPDEEKP